MTAARELVNAQSREVGDLHALATDAMQGLFTGSGVDGPMSVGHGLMAIGGVIKGRDELMRAHDCQLFTLFDPETEGEHWVWDEACQTHTYSTTSLVSRTRYSVAIHAATPGMILVRHRMRSDGQRHTRSSVTAWEVAGVNSDGSVRLLDRPTWVPSSLPPPHVSESSAASRSGADRGRGARRVVAGA